MHPSALIHPARHNNIIHVTLSGPSWSQNEWVMLTAMADGTDRLYCGQILDNRSYSWMEDQDHHNGVEGEALELIFHGYRVEQILTERSYPVDPATEDGYVWE